LNNPTQTEDIASLKSKAEKGDAEAHYQLAFKYSAGQGVDEDMLKAIEHYESAGKLGHINAMETLGNCYFRGDGVPKDLKKAHYWYEEGAKTGKSSYLQYLTALSYKEGMAGEGVFRKSALLAKEIRRTRQ